MNTCDLNNLSNNSEIKYKSAFLMLYLGTLPAYFDFWAKSCTSNWDTFHWYVYNDHVKQKFDYNKAVTLIPYNFSKLCNDLKCELGINIPHESSRIVCDCRIILYALRKKDDSLENYDFIGYSDIDVIYGSIKNFMPDNPFQYSLISADNNRPCGPFTLFNQKYLKKILTHNHIKSRLEQNFGNQIYQSDIYKAPLSTFKPISGNTVKDQIANMINFEHLDESKELINIAELYAPVFCCSHHLQPAISRCFNHRKAIGFWENGKLRVMDNRGHIKEGAFFHFSRFKNRNRFKVDSSVLSSNRWGIYKYGFIELKSNLTKLKMLLTLLY